MKLHGVGHTTRLNLVVLLLLLCVKQLLWKTLISSRGTVGYLRSVKPLQGHCDHCYQGSKVGGELVWGDFYFIIVYHDKRPFSI